MPTTSRGQSGKRWDIFRRGQSAQVLERVVHRIAKHLRRHGLLDTFDPNAELDDPEDQLAASAVSGQAARPRDHSGAAA